MKWMKLKVGWHLSDRPIAAILAAALCMGLCLTGCSEKAVPVAETELQSNSGLGAEASGQLYEQDFLSEELCVIPKKKATNTTDAAITAGAALLINDTKNKLILSKNIYDRKYPASITKIVTALIVLQENQLMDSVTVSKEAASITEPGATLCGLHEGDQISMENLLLCLLIYSGNDAAVAIAEHISGSVEAFAERMNEEMASLGASGSHFVNPHGLQDEEHYTTAYDLYLVFHQLLKYDTFREIISCPKYKVVWKDADGKKRKLKMSNTNRYLSGQETAPKGIQVIGGKTGTTIDAGSCLILYSQDKIKQDDYISIILKTDSSYSLYKQMTYLLEHIRAG